MKNGRSNESLNRKMLASKMKWKTKISFVFNMKRDWVVLNTYTKFILLLLLAFFLFECTLKHSTLYLAIKKIIESYCIDNKWLSHCLFYLQYYFGTTKCKKLKKIKWFWHSLWFIYIWDHAHPVKCGLKKAHIHSVSFSSETTINHS